ncbi:hypothetical protein [Bradyrhizobium liaoningense]|uniref:hypothetical protein n=1 Tax=Bradyrhizobium liaoningense TaxID=43992 RepID=UPI001BA912C7|nr:hypothetical protein [Bradyrhizobium liaoningense]MBR0712705.1 hypothetical protein [Bradyrhizobium liaoningense]
MTALAETAAKFSQYRRERAADRAPLPPRRPLTSAQFNHAADRSDADLVDLQRREGAAAERERMLDQRKRAVAEDRAHDRNALALLQSQGSDTAGPKPLPPVPEFVLEVFACMPAWEHEPTFCHARYVRSIRALAGSSEDAQTLQLLAADALTEALGPVAGMHSEWRMMHTAARRLVVRLESPFGDGEDDIGSLQRLHAKLSRISAMLITAEFVERRGLFASSYAPALVSLPAPKPASPAQCHADALRAAVERGDVRWTGDGPPAVVVERQRELAPAAPRPLSPRAAQMTIERLIEAGVPIPLELAAMARAER